MESNIPYKRRSKDLDTKTLSDKIGILSDKSTFNFIQDATILSNLKNGQVVNTQGFYTKDERNYYKYLVKSIDGTEGTANTITMDFGSFVIFDDLSIKISETLKLAPKPHIFNRIDIKSLGARGNGSPTNDNTKIMQLAINWIQTNGGGTVTLPHGNYYIKGITFTPKTFTDYNKVQIVGEDMYGTQLLCDNSSNDILIDMGGYYASGSRKQTGFVSFSNLRLSCSATTKNVLAFKHSVTQYCDMTNVWIEGFKGGAIHFYDAYDCNFYNVQIINSGRAISDTDYAPALGFYGTNDCANALHFVNCRLEFLPIFCFFANGARHIYFTNCKFEKMSLNLTSIRPFHFSSYREIAFSDCMFINSDHYLADTSSGITGSITSGTNTLTVNQTSGASRALLVGDFITITGVTGTKRINAINGLILTLDSNADTTVSNASVAGSYYIVDQGNDYFYFPSGSYDSYDTAGNLIKSAKFTNCHCNTPSVTSTRWGAFRYCEFENVVFNGCEGGSAVDRCFNIYDEVVMNNIKISSYNDAKLINLMGTRSTLKITHIKLKTGILSLVTVRTGADNNNVEIGSVSGATLSAPTQADTAFFFDQANSRYYYLKNNKIKLLGYPTPVDSNTKPTAWMDVDVVECTSTSPIEYVNFGHNGKRVTLVYTGSGGSLLYSANYMVTKTRANKTLATGDTVNLINHNGIWREV